MVTVMTLEPPLSHMYVLEISGAGREWCLVSVADAWTEAPAELGCGAVWVLEVLTYSACGGEVWYGIPMCFGSLSCTKITKPSNACETL